MLKDAISYVSVLSTAVIATAALYSGRFDPLYVVVIIFIAIALWTAYLVRRLKSESTAVPQEKKLVGLSEEYYAEKRRKELEVHRRDIRRSVITVASVSLPIILLVVINRDYFLRPVDSQSFETVGGDIAFDATDAHPHFFFRSDEIPTDKDASQDHLQLVYAHGHGSAFHLTKRKSVSNAVVTGFRVKITSLKPLPKVHIPIGGAAEMLPYVLVADIPAGATVGSEWTATYYKRDEKTKRLEKVPAKFAIGDAPEFFEVRVNSNTEGAMRFAVLADIEAGWRSASVPVGESDECLFLTQKSIDQATATPPPPGLRRMEQWINRGESRSSLMRNWNGRYFGAFSEPNAPPVGRHLGWGAMPTPDTPAAP